MLLPEMTPVAVSQTGKALLVVLSFLCNKVSTIDMSKKLGVLQHCDRMYIVHMLLSASNVETLWRLLSSDFHCLPWHSVSLL